MDQTFDKEVIKILKQNNNKINMKRLLKKKPKCQWIWIIQKTYDINENKDNLPETGILKIGQLKDNRKYY